MGETDIAQDNVNSPKYKGISMIKVVINPNKIEQQTLTPVKVIFTNENDRPCTNLNVAFDFPSGIILISGEANIKNLPLNSNERYEHTINILSKQAGEFAIGSRSFSYRDDLGKVIRQNLSIPLIVSAKKPKKSGATDDSKQASPSATPHRDPVDPFNKYENGLRYMETFFQDDFGMLQKLNSFATRLRENIEWSRLHGDTNERRADRSEIIYRLDDFAYKTTQKSFNDWCNQSKS